MEAKLVDVRERTRNGELTEEGKETSQEGSEEK